MLTSQALLDLGDQLVGIASDPRKYLAGLFTLAAEDQEARRLRNKQGAEQESRRWDRLHPKHPTPGGRPEPKDRARAAGDFGKNVVAEKCAEQTQHNGHLLERGEPGTQM